MAWPSSRPINNYDSIKSYILKVQHFTKASFVACDFLALDFCYPTSSGPCLSLCNALIGCSNSGVLKEV